MIVIERKIFAVGKLTPDECLQSYINDRYKDSTIVSVQMVTHHYASAQALTSGVISATEYLITRRTL